MRLFKLIDISLRNKNKFCSFKGLLKTLNYIAKKHSYKIDLYLGNAVDHDLYQEIIQSINYDSIASGLIPGNSSAYFLIVFNKNIYFYCYACSGILDLDRDVNIFDTSCKYYLNNYIKDFVSM